MKFSTTAAPSRPTAVSLFSGCGGFCEGVELSGFKVLCAVEKDKFAAENYRHNFPLVPLFEGDVSDFLRDNDDAQRKQLGLRDVDLLFGGPPCQGFSQIGPRQFADVRNSLYKEFTRLLGKLRPRVFLMENVPNLLLLWKGHFRDEILQEFRDLGYSNATVLKVTASDFGVPQVRNRIVFVGTRDEDEFPFSLTDYCNAFLAERKLSRAVTVWEAIGDLPESVVHSGETMAYPRPGGYSPFQRVMRLDFDSPVYPKAVKRLRGIGQARAILHNHHTKEILDRRMELISHLKPGFKGDSLPKEIWNGLRPEKWRRLHPDRPAYTILAQMHRDLSEWVHPHLARWITVREAARLQSFHDGFVFIGSEWQQLKQIGNAVPPLLAHVVASMAKTILSELDGKIPSRQTFARQVALLRTCEEAPASRSANLAGQRAKCA